MVRILGGMPPGAEKGEGGMRNRELRNAAILVLLGMGIAAEKNQAMKGTQCMKKNIRKIAGIGLILAAPAAAITFLFLPQRNLIRVSDVTSVRVDGTAVSYHAAMDLLREINTLGGHHYIVGQNHPAEEYEDIVEIHCEDGIRYELHYWYNSGFSFLHGTEDPYSSILTRYRADGTADAAWKLVYDFDEACRTWMEQYRIQ